MKKFIVGILIIGGMLSLAWFSHWNTTFYMDNWCTITAVPNSLWYTFVNSCSTNNIQTNPQTEMYISPGLTIPKQTPIRQLSADEKYNLMMFKTMQEKNKIPWYSDKGKFKINLLECMDFSKMNNSTCYCSDWYYRESETKKCKALYCTDTNAEMDNNWNCQCKNWYVLNETQSYDLTEMLNQHCVKDIKCWTNEFLNASWECVCKNWYTLNDENTCENSLYGESSKAIARMYENWLTAYKTSDKFMGDEYLTREQASKFFVLFAKKILGKTINTKKSISLSDLKKADKTLQSHIKEANQLWLFNWIKGKFLPFNKLTKAQAIAVIIRSMIWVQDEKSSPWYLEYYNIAKNNGILDGLWFDYPTLDSTNITRGEVAILLYRFKNFK